MAEPRRFRAILVRELTALELRRTASGTLALLAFAMILFATGVHREPIAAGLDGELQAAALRGLERVTGWTATLLLLGPALVLHAAGIVPRWRAGESDWLGAAPRSRAALLASTWLGCALGASLLVASAAVVVELRARDAGRTTRTFADHALSDYVRIEPGAVSRGSVAFPRWPAGSRLVVCVQPSLGSGPTTDARTLVRVNGAEESRTGHVAMRTWIEVPLPPVNPDRPGARASEQQEIEIEIANVGDGVLALVTPGTFELWAPAGSERLGSLGILVRALCALASVTALALGLGAWVGTASAAGLAVLAWVAGVVWLGGPTWWPGGDLVRVLDVVGQARLPVGLDARSIAATLVAGALGIALGGAGLRSWRYAR